MATEEQLKELSGRLQGLRQGVYNYAQANPQNPNSARVLTSLGQPQLPPSITPANLTSSPPFVLPPRPVPVAATRAIASFGVLADQTAAQTASQQKIDETVKLAEANKTQVEKDVLSAQQGILDIQGKRTDYEREQDLTGKLTAQNAARQQVQAFNTQLIQEQVALNRQIEEIEKNKVGRFSGAVEQEINRVSRESARKQADISLSKLVAQNAFENATFDLTTAQSIVQHKIDVELEPLKQKLEFNQYWDTNYRSELTKAEQRQWESIKTRDQRAYDQTKTDITTANNYLLKAGENGAPLPVFQSIQQAINSGRYDEARNLASPYLQSPEAGLDLQIKKAQLASLPVEQAIKQAQLKKLQLENRDLENPDFVATTGQGDDTLKLAAANIGAIVAKTGPAQKIFKNGYNTALSQGEDSAWRYLRNQYSNNVLAGKQQEDYFNVQDGLAGYQSALSFLEENPDLNTGFYKATAEGLKPKFNIPKDQRYATLLSLINQAETPIRKKNYGTAITGNELVTSQRSLFNEGDDRNTVLLKLRQGIVALDNGLNRGMSEAYGLPFTPKPYPLPGDVKDLSDDDLNREFQLFQSGGTPDYVNTLPMVSGFFSNFSNQIFGQ